MKEVKFTRKEVAEIMQRGKRDNRGGVIFFTDDKKEKKKAILVSKKYNAQATKRNKIKRKVREIVRKNTEQNFIILIKKKMTEEEVCDIINNKIKQ